MTKRHRPDMRPLLAWYGAHQRDLPWRKNADPYRVWLSEVMLQQTTVPTVLGYFERFLARWPTIEGLARASQDEVLAQWAGLGYYARARKLHECAKLIADECNGRFPNTIEALEELPGIGPYTARAVAAIAFNVDAVPLDGNIERVTARLFAVTDPLPQAKPRLAALAQSLAAPGQCGDLAQALMDLGATICTPTKPDCPQCPIRQDCRAQAQGLAETLPAREKRAAKPQRFGVAFFAERKSDGAFLVRKRPEKGLLGGMLELPGTDWRAEPWTDKEAMAHAPSGNGWRKAGRAKHVFTHFALDLVVMSGYATRLSQGCFWAKPDQLADLALPTLMKKALRIVRP
ncbi:MAG: A/G-specific adenine glycosylase [Rhodospirillales bacterium]|jgi:A/G-specific adenine glycosylase|nr:A/G-specific adenine glycosylase [Rhodospirillales bacterium]